MKPNMQFISTRNIVEAGIGIIILFACLLIWQIKFPVPTENKMTAFKARAVMVTGSNRGLGLEYVKQLLDLPTPPEIVIAACRNPASATDLQAVAKANPSVHIVKLDVADDKDIDSAFKETKILLDDRGLNVLINNAGIYGQTNNGSIESETREVMQQHFDINVSGPLMVTQKFLPLIKKAAAQNENLGLSPSRAGIIMMTSYMGSQTITHNDGAGESLHYKCSKSALTMAAIVLSRQLKNFGIFVAALHPGWVRTDMGGKSAAVSPEESVQGCLKTLGLAGEDKNGRLLTFQNEVLPF